MPLSFNVLSESAHAARACRLGGGWLGGGWLGGGRAWAGQHDPVARALGDRPEGSCEDVGPVVRLSRVRFDEQRPERAGAGTESFVVAEEEAAGAGGGQEVERRRDLALCEALATAR